MNLLEFLGINPKEQEKVEAKIGLELAISGRLEHRVCSMINERLTHEEVDEEVLQLIKEINEHLADCGEEFLYVTTIEDDLKCIQFDYDCQLVISNFNDEWLKDELGELKFVIERWREDFWDVSFVGFNEAYPKMEDIVEIESVEEEKDDPCQATLDKWLIIVRVPPKESEVKFMDEYDLDGYTNHSTNVTMFGKCETYFYGVCPASEDEDINKICDDCPMRDEVIEDIESC